MSAPYDAVVIGSGFGGAVAACRLAHAGRSVLVLERGRRWLPEQYPRGPDDAWIWDQNRPERHNGWIDMRFLNRMWVAAGAGVGGGSLIYASVSIDAKPSVFASGWPSEINHGVLQPYYARVAEMLGSRPLPDGQLTRRFELMRDAATAIGAETRFTKVDIAVTFDDRWSYDLPDAHNPRHSSTHTNPFGKTQGTCIHCGNCDIGCQVQAKNTLDLNYIAAAEADGAVVQPLSLVTHISPAAAGWCVHYDKLEDGRRVSSSVIGRRVILAAGSLGSTEILLRSRDDYRTLPDISPHLGRGWSSNGDFVTPAVYAGRKIDPTVGPTITAAIDFLDGSEKGKRFFVEDGGFPNVLRNYLQAKARHAGRFGPQARFFRHLLGASLDDPLPGVMPWFGQGIDAANGHLRLARHWWAPWRRSLALDWNPTESEGLIDGLIDIHRRLAKATGGEIVVPPTWSLLRQLVTPHPLGGCAMSASPAAGVVDHAGRVFGHAGLYVLDGAIVPRALGLNPSKTIAALAERGVALMLAEDAGSAQAAPSRDGRRDLQDLQNLPRTPLLSFAQKAAAPIAPRPKTADLQPIRYPLLSAFGNGKFLEWFWNYVTLRLGRRHPFQTYTASDPDQGIYRMPGGDETVRLVLAGDWATGTDEAHDVAQRMAEDAPHYAIHLGDVYYYGGPGEVAENFLGQPNPRNFYEPCRWPDASLGRFALNGNHEMYALGKAYFNAMLPTLGPKIGGVQQKQKASFFCLENEHWRIIALDTGYKSIGWPFVEYVFSPSCALRREEIAWLRETVCPDPTDRRGIIILTHHQYYSRYDNWYVKTARQLAEFFDRPVLWFWGHEHRMAVYEEFAVPRGIAAYGRCIGHGGMPVDLPPARPPHPECSVEFTDLRRYPNDENLTIGYNGYARLTLRGARAAVDYIDIDGAVIFSECWTADAQTGLRRVPLG
ncbi:GMC family oxidoreductase [Acidisoma cellulosilytica]|uniref:Cholesterol oxidase n=1 Tax=Acidisoma cellulosilyticum TaxID=2802395 RepID=A0A963Z6N9_9PROT|nr:GMC oxidoreductase [Acidisoma cellulosilyticum]MCB8883070.1 GMC family oxidoreductase [Acidisoma cellulosilyticum]